MSKVSPDAIQLDPRARRILRSRRWRRGAITLLLVALGVAVIGSRSRGAGVVATDKTRFHQQHGTVAEVVAGDDLRVVTDRGTAATVRLIGVDANASPAAAAFAREACRGGVLLYLQDVPTRDHAGDLLAYVFLPDGSLLNETLIARGLAYADRRWDYAYRSTFTQVEAAASKKRLGLWADDSHERTMPEWRQRWLTEVRKKPWKRQEWVRADEP